jgi:carbamoyl-phosphate synthase large subunit
MLVNEDFNSSRFELPVIVKPRMGGGSRGVELIEQRGELERIDRDGSLLAQESLPGTEYSLNTLARSDGRVVAVVPWTRSSFGSEIAIHGNARRRAGLEAIGRQVAELIGLTSMANIKVKEASDGKPALLGVNPGFAGMMPLTMVAGGLNMPRFCIDDALGDLALAGVANG